MKTIAEVSRETLLIEAYLRTLQPGMFVPYTDIEHETGVPMDLKGKGYMRTAMNRLKTEYTCVRGKGITLADQLNATSIIAHKVIRIDSAVNRAAKTTKRISNQFYDLLNANDQQHVNVLEATFGAIKTYALAAKRIFKGRQPGDNLSLGA
jgi:hypothetical protein